MYAGGVQVARHGRFHMGLVLESSLLREGLRRVDLREGVTEKACYATSGLGMRHGNESTGSVEWEFGLGRKRNVMDVE